MDDQAALELLKAAVRRRQRAKGVDKRARVDLYEAVRTVAPVLQQRDIVRETGWSREYIRRIVDKKPEGQE